MAGSDDTIQGKTSSLKKTAYLIGRENRGKWLLLIAMAVFASAFELIGAGLVYVLITLVADGGSEVSLPVIGDIRQLFPVDEDLLLLGLASVMGLFFLVRAAVRVGTTYVQDRITQTAGARMATMLVQGYLLMPYQFHLRRRSADLIRNGNQTVAEIISRVFNPIVAIGAETVLVVAMLVFLAVMAPAATGLAILVIGGAAVILLAVVQPRLKSLGRVVHDMNLRTLGTLQQSLHGIKDIKILNRERSFVERYQEARLRLARSNYVATTVYSLPSVIMELALLSFILLIFSFSILLEGGADAVLPVLGLFAYAGLRLQPSLQKIIGGLNSLKYAAAPIEAIYRDLREVEEVTAVESVEPSLRFRNELTLNGVNFCYDGSNAKAIEQLSLSIRAGEFVGICGPTGGGKSTLVDIITGLLEPTEGSVVVDGQSLSKHTRAWQRTLGVVPQMVFLTDESLRANIALGVPAVDVDEEAVLAAVSLAQLQEFVDSLPDGLETTVGERGIRLSGGQRQRVAIARALYRKPTVLVFDEGTSALDNMTERALMQSIERLRGQHTIVMVAHRLSTVKTADRILVIEHGRLTGTGTYEELRRSHASFRSLAGT